MNAPAPITPGWRMSPGQCATFWRLWAAACRCQGWDELSSAERDAQRHRVLAELGFASAKDIGKTEDFDRVKARLLELADVVSHEPADAGERRRLLNRIDAARADLRAAGYPAAAIETILRERFHIVPGVSTVADLPTPELVNVLRTFTARLHARNRRRYAVAA